MVEAPAIQPADAELANGFAEESRDNIGSSPIDVVDEAAFVAPAQVQSASLAVASQAGSNENKRPVNPESSRLAQTEGQLSVDGQVDSIANDASLIRPSNHRLENNGGDVFDEMRLDQIEERFTDDESDDRMVQSSDEPIGIATQPDASASQSAPIDWGDRFVALFTTRCRE
ncbi:MAG: hypothetical protein AAFN70_16880, partial [Planctomycetota bacterium]